MGSASIITDLSAFLALYGAFALKQFLGDFLLQPGWIARGKGAGSGWLRPLTVHAGVHGALTMLIAMVAAPALWWLGIVDFAVHFTIDRTKAIVTRRLSLQPCDDAFWWAFGADQMAHQMTHVAWVLVLIRA